MLHSFINDRDLIKSIVRETETELFALKRKYGKVSAALMDPASSYGPETVFELAEAIRRRRVMKLLAEHALEELAEQEEKFQWAMNQEKELSQRDSELLVDALANPPEPNEKLKGLFSGDDDFVDYGGS